jgi:hypothetical protein
MAAPSRSRVILESVIGAFASVIVAKLVARTLGGEISTAVLSGIAGGVVALIFARRSSPRPVAARHVENPADAAASPTEAPASTLVEPTQGSPTASGDANSTGKVS